MPLKNFTSNEEGSTLIIFAFLLIVLFGIAALTIDLNISQGEYASNQGAVDAAAVAAADFYERKQAEGVEKPEGYEEFAEHVHEENTMRDQSHSEIKEFDVKIVGDQVNVRACLEVINSIAPVAGLAETTLVCNTSTHKIRESEMKYVLIYVVLTFSGGNQFQGVSSSTNVVEFESKANCEIAENAINTSSGGAYNNQSVLIPSNNGHLGSQPATIAAKCFAK